MCPSSILADERARSLSRDERPPSDHRMPFAFLRRVPLDRPARHLVTAGIALATLLTVFPTPAAALEPPSPLPGYRPTFVTETDTRPWKDCLWASGAMLLDKWTNGDVKVTRQALRAASGDFAGGSQFRDLTRAFAKYGFDLKWSPDGGVRLTWGQLMAKLERGAGAVVLGDDHKLPAWFGRWDYGFWKKKGKKDNHAVYIERYDRKHDRVWLMDPLGRGDWQGEWISAWAIRRFTWSRAGAVFAAVTPNAKAAPFAKVKTAANPRLVRSAGVLDAAWKVQAPKAWKFPGADVKAKFVVATDPLAAAAVSPAVPAKNSAAASTTKRPRQATLTLQGRTLHLSTPLPTEQGAWTLHVNVTDKRFGRTVVTARDVAVFVPGDRRATTRLVVREDAVQAGSSLKVTANVANTGTETWAGTWTLDAGAGSMTIDRGTRAIVRWIRLGADGQVIPTEDAAAAEPVLLDAVPLAPGDMAELRAALKVPDELGTWALVTDVVDDVDGSYAALGSQPSVVVIEVVAPRGRDEVQ